jgi:hypothetical protein
MALHFKCHQRVPQRENKNIGDASSELAQKRGQNNRAEKCRAGDNDREYPT